MCRSDNQHFLAISSQHVAVLAAVIYFLLLRTFAIPAATRTPTTLALMWLYILLAGGSSVGDTGRGCLHLRARCWALRAPGLVHVIVDLTTDSRSSSLPRWGRRRRSRWL